MRGAISGGSQIRPSRQSSSIDLRAKSVVCTERVQAAQELVPLLQEVVPSSVHNRIIGRSMEMARARARAKVSSCASIALLSNLRREHRLWKVACFRCFNRLVFSAEPCRPRRQQNRPEARAPSRRKFRNRRRRRRRATDRRTPRTRRPRHAKEFESRSRLLFWRTLLKLGRYIQGAHEGVGASA